MCDEINFGNFFALFVGAVPEFRGLYEENLADYGHILQYAMMADFYPLFLEEYDASLADTSDAARHREVVVRSLTFLENAMGSSDRDVHDLIGLSFLEGFPPEGSCPGLRALMGPRLRLALKVFE